MLKLELEDPAGALAAIDRSLASARSMLVSESPQLAMQMMNRGEVLEALGRHAESEAHHEDALRRWESFLPRDHPWLAYPLTGLGNALRSQGRTREAMPVLERALRIRERGEHSPQPLAETRFALARALWDASGDRDQHARARALAVAARDGYRSVSWTARAGHVEDWLAAHPAARPSAVQIAQKQ